MAHLLRACILADGTLKAVFSDCSVLVLTPRATAFLHVDAQGQAVQQCTQFALSRWHAKLSMVVELRNQHCNSISLCKAFTAQQPGPPGFSTAVPCQAVRWPASVGAACAEQLLVAEPDGTVTLLSEDRCAKLVLHASGLRLAVTWPAPVPGSSGRCLWLTQTFSAGDCPSEWEAPLALALAAQQQQLEGGNQMEHAAAEQHGAGPPDQNHRHLVSADACLAPAQRVSQLPTVVNDTGIECCSFPQGSWWFDSGTSTFPPDALLLLEWTPEAVYQFLPRSQEVEVIVAADESLLRLDRRGYVRHYQPGSWRAPKTYAAQAVPSFAWGSSAGARYPLAMIVAHAAALREVSARLCSLGRAPPTSALSGNSTTVEQPAAPAALTVHSLPSCCPQPPAATSHPAQQQPLPANSASAGSPGDSSVLERQVVPGHGTFTAFAGGAVHVSFEDRTVLKLAPDRQSFQALLPCGRHVTAPVSQPAELQPYLASALEFAAWAGISPLERSVPMAKRQQVHAELSSTRRQAALCSMALHQVPAPMCSSSTGMACDSSASFAAHRTAQTAAQSAAALDSSAVGDVAWGAGPEEDYMLKLVASGSCRESERETLVEAWLRRNSLVLDSLGG